MHDPYTGIAVRWMALMTGAAHATTLLRQMARELPPTPESDDDALPPIVTRPSMPLLTSRRDRPPDAGQPPIAH